MSAATKARKRAAKAQVEAAAAKARALALADRLDATRRLAAARFDRAREHLGDALESSGNGVAHRFEPARERAAELAGRARATAGSAREQARHGAVVAREQARQRAAVARDRAADLAERYEVGERLDPAKRKAQAGAAGALRGVSRGLDRAPGVIGRVLAALVALAGVVSARTEDFSERGRELAYERLAPPPSVVRRTRARSAAWFFGGVLAGAATGWIAHSRLRATEDDWFDEVEPTGDIDLTAPDEAPAYEARQSEAADSDEPAS